jgi:hypothetical protein
MNKLGKIKKTCLVSKEKSNDQKHPLPLARPRRFAHHLHRRQMERNTGSVDRADLFHPLLPRERQSVAQLPADVDSY